MVKYQGTHPEMLKMGRLDAGMHNIIWDGMIESGVTAASGVYFYRLKTSDNEISKQMALLK